jgi:inosine/xanthosine triphosphate pyrophosphatase family protein
MKTLTFITSNQKKVEQLKRYLDFPVDHRGLELPEIQSLDLVEVATEKAKAAYEMHGGPVLVEDIGLSFTALKGCRGHSSNGFSIQSGMKVCVAWSTHILIGLHGGEFVLFFTTKRARIHLWRSEKAR